MIKRILSAAALALTLASCNVTAPPRDNAQWTSTVRGVSITWRWTAPGALGEPVVEAGVATQVAGHTTMVPGGQSCVVDIDPVAARGQVPRVAAHEAGHCLQARYLKVSADPQNPDPYTHQLSERWAEAYAQAYLRECGPSLRPLGWADGRDPDCAQAPDPDSIPFSW
ncbi:hypothetical protein GCM10008959_26380 [Deinococcus seoulensis]|uniref:Lipoprotein n=1 Tax=Deinococcus seoulensis TaxID=1837379 RepID=A0ABQ2RWH4_9DEIO|nr:hypothetical protein [Deinococcus seoulensis]GGR63008.1 hypothetical protein GCM10008959_26380 [Deinococcus seoulensis]